jgi:hypothetical protein
MMRQQPSELHSRAARSQVRVIIIAAVYLAALRRTIPVVLMVRFATVDERGTHHKTQSPDLLGPYVDLELFEPWRGRGLPIETPAIRR